MVSDGTAVFALKDLRNRHNVGDIVIKDTTPKDYEYLLPCDGQTFDKTVYVLLAELYPDGVLPNLNDNRFLEGAETAGTSKDAGLPNIEGSTGTTGTSCFKASGSTGVFSNSPKSSNKGITSWGGTNSDTIQLRFDASQSNSIYGNSDTVQPKSYTVKYYVCYA